jgi:hypothetical protein
MALFRAQDRLREDPRVLVISDLEDFALYREREKLKIKGIVMPYNVSSDAVDAAKLCARSNDIPKLEFIFDHGANKGSPATSSFRINSNYPPIFHQHRTALTLGILNSGTVCQNESGEEYTIPGGHILICEDILHRAPPDDTPHNEGDDPHRATFVTLNAPC